MTAERAQFAMTVMMIHRGAIDKSAMNAGGRDNISLILVRREGVSDA